MAALFKTLNLEKDERERILEVAEDRLKREGVDTVADLAELPEGSCEELVDSLDLPPIKAKRLLSALEGEARERARCRMLCDVRERRSATQVHATEACRRRPSWRCLRLPRPSGRHSCHQ